MRGFAVFVGACANDADPGDRRAVTCAAGAAGLRSARVRTRPVNRMGPVLVFTGWRGSSPCSNAVTNPGYRCRASQSARSSIGDGAGAHRMAGTDPGPCCRLGIVSVQWQHAHGTAISVVGRGADAGCDPGRRISRQAGSSAYRCVRVGHNRDVRSGGFLAGNFEFDEQGFAAAYQQARRHSAVKIYWVPLLVDHMSELTVQATLLSGQRVTRTYHQSQAATGGGVVFYPSAVPIPVPGTWKLVFDAGPNRGCFIVTFPAPA